MGRRARSLGWKTLLLLQKRSDIDFLPDCFDTDWIEIVDTKPIVHGSHLASSVINFNIQLYQLETICIENIIISINMRLHLKINENWIKLKMPHEISTETHVY